jgi:molybdopterin-guanine dinucleotide biosynthesis protein A
MTGGVVLCGGRSSRMGRPKAWLPFGEELMLQRVVRVLREVVEPVVVVAARGQDVPPLPAEVEIVRDEVEGRGPLQGLAAGLAALEGKADAAYLSSCDVPLLLPGFVRRMVSLLSGGRQPPEGSFTQGADAPRSEGVLVAVPKVDGFHHPLAAAYRTSVLDAVRDLLAADRLRPVFLFDAVPTRVVGPHELADVDPALQSLRNLNTPADYEAALRDLA